MTYRDNAGPEWVRCGQCSERVQLPKADMVELGYLCPKCSAQRGVGYTDSPELFVPSRALVTPAGATPNVDGSVVCFQCGRSMTLAQADIVGEGYRCAVCSHNAQVAIAHGQSDLGSHLSRRDRGELAGFSAPIGGGIALLVGGVKGKVITGFAEPRSKGIDIDGKLGEPVVAAASGRVTYIGSGIPGLGKLVVIKHDNGFITVYAHNRNIVVKEQQAVARGQKIAELGASDSDRPKLHFQIRKGAAAVDPLRYLPAL